jgi:hypothetical protein
LDKLGVDNTDPAVKMIVGGLLRANASTAGAAVTHNVECELRSVSLVAESAATSLLHAREAFEEGKNELHDFLDDIDERREDIKNVKRDLLMLRRRVESHWRNDDMDLQTRYHKSVEAIHANPLKDWHHMRGMAPMKGEESEDEKIFFFYFQIKFSKFLFFLSSLVLMQVPCHSFSRPCVSAWVWNQHLPTQSFYLMIVILTSRRVIESQLCWNTM